MKTMIATIKQAGATFKIPVQVKNDGEIFTKDVMPVNQQENEDGISKDEWKVNPDNIEQVLIKSDYGMKTIHLDGFTIQEAYANAKLIAAAPDLLEALEKFVATEAYRKLIKQSNGQFDTAYESALTAIKKATK